VIANLKPAKLMGLESQGMVLAATDASGKLSLLVPDASLPSGAKVS
jgi:methionyl-tRNA synthetase